MKIKKILTVLIVSVLALGSFTLLACGGGDDAKSGLTFTEQGGVYAVSGYEGESTSVVIPDSHEGKNVAKISAEAFSGKKITEITIPASVVEIGKDAFVGCDKLTKVTYRGAADNWVEIKFASADSNPVSICKNLVINGEKLTTLALTTATKISDYAFKGYTPLTSVDIGDNVVSVGISAFEDCSLISSLTLGDKVESFEYRAFGTCSSLTSVVFTDSVKVLYEEAFRDCGKLENVYIPASLTSIQKAAFNYDTALTSVTFEVTEGWFVTESLASSIGEDIDPELLENAEEAAKLLSVKSYNRAHYWKRAEQ